MAPRRKYEDDGWNAGYDNGYPSPEERPDWWIDDEDDGWNAGYDFGYPSPEDGDEDSDVVGQ